MKNGEQPALPQTLNNMETTKHTPAPWVLSNSSTGHFINTEDGINIATLEGISPTRLANAHLIAAAPELLEALELLSNYSNQFPIDSEVFLRVESAIAKAKGL